MTLAELRTALGELLEVDTDRYPDTVRTRHINKAIRALELDLEGPWTVDSGALAFTAGTQAVALSAMTGNTLTPNQLTLVYITVATGPKELQLLTWDQFTAAYRLLAVAEDEPVYYAVRNEMVYLGPTPAENVTLTCDFFGLQPKLAADGDSNNWTTAAEDLVLAQAVMHALPWLLEGERAAEFAPDLRDERERWALHWSHEYNRGRVMEAEEV